MNFGIFKQNFFWNLGQQFFLVLIRALIADHNETGHSVKFVWAPMSHVGIEENEKPDSLVESATIRFWSQSINKTPFSDLILHHLRVIRIAWCLQWMSHTSTASWFKFICPDIPRFPWLVNVNFTKFYNF